MQQPHEIDFKTSFKILEIRKLFIGSILRRFVGNFPTAFHCLYKLITKLWAKIISSGRGKGGERAK